MSSESKELRLYNMVCELSMPSFGGHLGDLLESVEAVVSLQQSPPTSFLSSQHQHKKNAEIETYIGGFSILEDTTQPPPPGAGGIFLPVEPTPIDPKRVVVVDTFHPSNTSTWYISAGTTTTNIFFDATIIRGLQTLIENSSFSSKVLPAAYQSGPLAAETRKAPPEHVLDKKNNPRFTTTISSNKNTRARISSARSEEVDSTTISSCTTIHDDASTLRSNHIEQWDKRFSELVEYQKQFGHCLVPMNWPHNPSLAHWVKRQRYQYRIKNEGKHSSMTPERLEALQALGFTWDSHSVAWMERFQELAEFKQWYGHPNVPKQYPENSQLAVWVKCQRRQYKLFALGRRSNMTPDRIERLNSLGFVFNPRSAKVPIMPFLRGSGGGSWP